MLEFFLGKIMEFTVYILFSALKNKFYIGFTADIVSRLIRHNQKSKGFTGSVNDWELLYTEKYESKIEAQNREIQIKSWKSSMKIKALIDNKD